MAENDGSLVLKIGFDVDETKLRKIIYDIQDKFKKALASAVYGIETLDTDALAAHHARSFITKGRTLPDVSAVASTVTGTSDLTSILSLLRSKTAEALSQLTSHASESRAMLDEQAKQIQDEKRRIDEAEKTRRATVTSMQERFKELTMKGYDPERDMPMDVWMQKKGVRRTGYFQEPFKQKHIREYRSQLERRWLTEESVRRSQPPPLKVYDELNEEWKTPEVDEVMVSTPDRTPQDIFRNLALMGGSRDLLDMMEGEGKGVLDKLKYVMGRIAHDGEAMASFTFEINANAKNQLEMASRMSKMLQDSLHEAMARDLPSYQMITSYLKDIIMKGATYSGKDYGFAQDVNIRLPKYGGIERRVILGRAPSTDEEKTDYASKIDFALQQAKFHSIWGTMPIDNQKERAKAVYKGRHGLDPKQQVMWMRKQFDLLPGIAAGSGIDFDDALDDMAGSERGEIYRHLVPRLTKRDKTPNMWTTMSQHTRNLMLAAAMRDYRAGEAPTGSLKRRDISLQYLADYDARHTDMLTPDDYPRNLLTQRDVIRAGKFQSLVLANPEEYSPQTVDAVVTGILRRDAGEGITKMHQADIWEASGGVLTTRSMMALDARSQPWESESRRLSSDESLRGSRLLRGEGQIPFVFKRLSGILDEFEDEQESILQEKRLMNMKASDFDDIRDIEESLRTDVAENADVLQKALAKKAREMKKRQKEGVEAVEGGDIGRLIDTVYTGVEGSDVRSSGDIAMDMIESMGPLFIDKVNTMLHAYIPEFFDKLIQRIDETREINTELDKKLREMGE